MEGVCNCFFEADLHLDRPTLDVIITKTCSRDNRLTLNPPPPLNHTQTQTLLKWFWAEIRIYFKRKLPKAPLVYRPHMLYLHLH